jgi:hypothetical protein
MSISSSTPPPDKTHEPGAMAAWGLIVGALIGLVLGLMFGKVLALCLCAGAVGWVVGALFERSRK